MNLGEHVLKMSLDTSDSSPRSDPSPKNNGAPAPSNEDELSGIGAFKKREEEKKKRIRSGARPYENSVYQLLASAKKNPTALQTSLNHLKKDASSLKNALLLLSTAPRIRFIGSDGTSHLLSDSSVAALGLGAGPLSQRIEELGPVVFVYSKRMLSPTSQPSFRFDLRHFYRPQDALTGEQLSSLPESQGDDTWDYFYQHQGLLRDIIKGLGDDEWPQIERYFKLDRPHALPSQLADGDHDAQNVLDKLLEADSLTDAQKLGIILYNVLGATTKEVRLTTGDEHMDSFKIYGWTQWLFDSLRDSPPSRPGNLLEPLAQSNTSKQQTAKNNQKRLDATLTSLVGEMRPFKTYEQAQAEIDAGRQWIERWAPTGTRRTNPHALQDVLYLVLIRPDPRDSEATPYPPKRLRIMPEEYEAIVVDARKENRWSRQQISELYKKLRGLGPLMELVEENPNGPDPIRHWVSTSDVFRTLFKDWGETQQLTADYELLESSRGREEEAYTEHKNAVTDSIRNGAFQLQKRSDSHDRSRKAPKLFPGQI